MPRKSYQGFRLASQGVAGQGNLESLDREPHDTETNITRNSSILDERKHVAQGKESKMARR